MKICPQCSTQYADDTLSFCLDDGTRLVGGTVETPTVVLNEAETVVRNAGAWQSGQPTQFVPQNYPQQAPPPVPTARSGSGGSKVFIVIAAVALGFFAIVGILAVAGYVYFNASAPAVANVNANRTPVPNSNRPSVNTISPTPAISPSPTPTATQAPANVPSPTPKSEVASYPSTQRLKMSSGSYTSSASGSINPGDTRSFVLACRAGQQLTASIASGGPCVTISNGGSAIKWTTVQGDNKVMVRNNCQDVAKFSLSVSVY
jgi:hypothetical protein